MAVVVVGEAGFDLEVLAGEADVVGLGAGDGDRFAKWFVEGLPDCGFGSIRHANGATEMIGMDEGDGAGGARDIGNC